MHLYGDGFLAAFAQCCAVYYIGACLLHWVLPRLFSFPSVRKGTPRPGQVRQETLNSIGALAVKAAILTAVEKLHKAGYTKLYTGPIQTPSDVLYVIATIGVMDVLHDAWFYWTHRLLHWKPLYRKIHYMHHRSNVPTPFAGYSFHVVEALIVFANEIIVTFLFPIHASVHCIYHHFMSLVHMGGHAGYEMSPFFPCVAQLVIACKQGLKSSPLLNTVRHHDLHHQIPTVHFSLYFCHWDRLMGTEHPSYASYQANLIAQQS